MKLEFFSKTFLNKLRSAAAAPDNYALTAQWLDDLGAGHAYRLTSSVEVGPTPRLRYEDDPSKHDAYNAQAIHSWLSGLTPSVAMEERLWACLTHHYFPAYMSARWPITDENLIKRRYLLETTAFSGISRNGIARLWWAAHLTYDASRTADPYECTGYLFMRQDIQVALMERSIGKCHHLRLAVLEYLAANATTFGATSFGERIQALIKELNLHGAVTLLDALPKKSMEELVKRSADRVMRRIA